MMGVDFKQESWRYFSNSLIEIARMAVAAAILAALIAVCGRGWVELKGKGQVEGRVGRILN